MSHWPETRISILKRLSDGSDGEAWAFFENHYQQPIYRFARSRGLHPDEANDVVQEVMMAVHKVALNWQPSNRRGSFRAWLAESARRITLQVTRRRSRVGRGLGGSDFLSIAKETSAPTEVENDSLSERRWEFYCAAERVQNEVSQQHWLAFWRTTIDGKSAEEVGKELGMKIGTVYSAKCRVLAKLKLAINPGGETSDEMQIGDHS